MNIHCIIYVSEEHIKKFVFGYFHFQKTVIISWGKETETKKILFFYLAYKYINCHSPTQPQLELVLDLIMGRNPPHHTGTFKALPDNLGS